MFGSELLQQDAILQWMINVEHKLYSFYENIYGLLEGTMQLMI
jgi:hypothetical protein